MVAILSRPQCDNYTWLSMQWHQVPISCRVHELINQILSNFVVLLFEKSYTVNQVEYQVYLPHNLFHFIFFSCLSGQALWITLGNQVLGNDQIKPQYNQVIYWTIIQAKFYIYMYVVWFRLCMAQGIYLNDMKIVFFWNRQRRMEWVSEWLSLTAFLEQRTARSI